MKRFWEDMPDKQIEGSDKIMIGDVNDAANPKSTTIEAAKEYIAGDKIDKVPNFTNSVPKLTSDGSLVPGLMICSDIAHWMGYNIEVDRGTRGLFLDTINPETGEYYELKHGDIYRFYVPRVSDGDVLDVDMSQYQHLRVYLRYKTEAGINFNALAIVAGMGYSKSAQVKDVFGRVFDIQIHEGEVGSFYPRLLNGHEAPLIVAPPTPRPTKEVVLTADNPIFYVEEDNEPIDGIVGVRSEILNGKIVLGDYGGSEKNVTFIISEGSNTITFDAYNGTLEPTSRSYEAGDTVFCLWDSEEINYWTLNNTKPPQVEDYSNVSVQFVLDNQNFKSYSTLSTSDDERQVQFPANTLTDNMKGQLVFALDDIEYHNSSAGDAVKDGWRIDKGLYFVFDTQNGYKMNIKKVATIEALSLITSINSNGLTQDGIWKSLYDGSEESRRFEKLVEEANLQIQIEAVENNITTELNNYVQKSELPAPTQPGVFDVSPMFDISTDADVSVFMFRRETEIDKPLIKLHGFDNSGATDDLIITPALGFGANYDSMQAVRATDDGDVFHDYTINIEKETGENGKIIIPYGLKTFDISYYCHIGENIKASYYIDTANVVHPFELENTPFENFCTSASSIVINGTSIAKSTIKELFFGDSYRSVTSIEDSFLNNCSNLTSIDLSGLSNVTSIENDFLYDCNKLTSIDLSSLSNVTSIGYSFLADCSSLTSIDLSPLSNVTSIEDSFLSNCSNLTSIDLSGLSNVTSIENDFLYDCNKLTSIDLSGLSNVTSIGRDFLNGCNSLTSIDLSSLSNVTSIEDSFLNGCSNLTSIDLSGLSNVTSIGSDFLYDCNKLTSIDLSSLSNVTSIGYSFLADCSSLTSIDLSPLSNVTSIEDYFLADCSSLQSLQISAVDWSEKTVTGSVTMSNIPNTAACTLYADSQELADAFKAKMSGKISNWTVIVNE